MEGFMNPLQNVPAPVRIRLYWIGYVVGVTSQGVTGVWAIVAASSPTVSMPIWLVIASAILAFLQTQLNLIAGSNVSEPNTVSLTTPGSVESVQLTAVAGSDASARPLQKDRTYLTAEGRQVPIEPMTPSADLPLTEPGEGN